MSELLNIWYPSSSFCCSCIIKPATTNTLAGKSTVRQNSSLLLSCACSTDANFTFMTAPQTNLYVDLKPLTWDPPFIFTIYDKYIGLCFAKVSLCISVKEPVCALHVVHWAPTRLDHTYSAETCYMDYTTLFIRLHAGRVALQPKGTALTGVTNRLPGWAKESGWSQHVIQCKKFLNVEKGGSWERREIGTPPPPHKEEDRGTQNNNNTQKQLVITDIHHILLLLYRR